jgi:hypothetical protein
VEDYREKVRGFMGVTVRQKVKVKLQGGGLSGRTVCQKGKGKGKPLNTQKLKGRMNNALM